MKSETRLRLRRAGLLIGSAWRPNSRKIALIVRIFKFTHLRGAHSIAIARMLRLSKKILSRSALLRVECSFDCSGSIADERARFASSAVRHL
jgi:hypothetical protein